MTTLYLCAKHNMATVIGPASAESCERCEVLRLRDALEYIASGWPDGGADE